MDQNAVNIMIAIIGAGAITGALLILSRARATSDQNSLEITKPIVSDNAMVLLTSIVYLVTGVFVVGSVGKIHELIMFRYRGYELSVFVPAAVFIMSLSLLHKKLYRPR